MVTEGDIEDIKSYRKTVIMFITEQKQYLLVTVNAGKQIILMLKNYSQLHLQN